MGLNIVCIAQEGNFTDEVGAASSEIINPSVGPAVGKSVCDFINAECSYIGQTLIREQTENRSTMIKGKPVPMKVKTGKKEYCLRVGAHEVFQAGFRVQAGVEIQVDFVVNPSYEKIVQIIQTGNYT